MVTVTDVTEPPTASTSAEKWSRGVDHGQRLLGKRAFVSGAGTSPDGNSSASARPSPSSSLCRAPGWQSVTLRQRADATKELIDKLGGGHGRGGGPHR